MKVYMGNYPEDGGSEREIFVHIDYPDVWSLYTTLAHIITPALEMLKEKRHGSARTDAEDLPEELRSGDWHEGWEYVLTEMIWAFKQVRDSESFDWTEDEYDRVQNGLRLFGKYYFDLWD